MNKVGKNIRKSNLELLRIVSMIMIIMSHYVAHSNVFIEEISFNRFFINAVSSFGKLGVGLFVIISGYFCCKSNFKISKITDIIIKVWSYSFVGLIIGIATNSELLTKINIVKSIFPNLFGLYWFTSCYILVYLFSPFIKKIISLLEKGDLKKLITIMCVLWFGISMIPSSKVYCSEFMNLLTIYIIGAYIWKYKLFINEKKKKNIFVTIIIILVQILIINLIDYFSIKFEFLGKYVSYFNALNSPIILALTILIFRIFLNINVENIPMINKIASSTLGIYLLHDNIFIRNLLWNNIVKVNESTDWLIINFIISIVGVFIVASLIDLIMQKVLIFVSKILKTCVLKIIKNKKTSELINKVKEFYL